MQQDQRRESRRCRAKSAPPAIHAWHTLSDMLNRCRVAVRALGGRSVRRRRRLPMQRERQRFPFPAVVPLLTDMCHLSGIVALFIRHSGFWPRGDDHSNGGRHWLWSTNRGSICTPHSGRFVGGNTDRSSGTSARRETRCRSELREPFDAREAHTAPRSASPRENLDVGFAYLSPPTFGATGVTVVTNNP